MPTPTANIAIFILSVDAAIKPAANRRESPVINGTKTPIKSPVPAKISDQTTT
jgi:hypothetical protein